MGSLVLMLPALAFDVWLLASTGKNQCRKWVRARAWSKLAGAAIIGLALGICLAFFVSYKWDDKMRVTGFPIPGGFASLEDGKWVAGIPTPLVRYPAAAVNLLSGLAATMVPFKFAEFLQSVKAELAR